MGVTDDAPPRLRRQSCCLSFLCLMPVTRKQPSFPWKSFFLWLYLAIAPAPASTSAAVEDRELNELLKIPLWDYSGEVRGGLGYKDNVLLSNTNAIGSGFWMSGAEAMLFRLPTGGWQYHFFADITDNRYLDAPEVGSEQVAVAATELSKDLGSGWKSGLELNYLYQNQVFDDSANYYTNQTSIGKIVGHTLAPQWTLRKALGAFWLEAEVNGTRQWLEEPLDDYWQYGPRAAAAYEFGNRSELKLAYQPSRLDYDSREQVDRDGAPIPDSSLSLNSHLVELSLTYAFDPQRRWQSITLMSFEASRDNASGFYDYDNYRLSQQLRFRDKKWEVSVRVRVSYYHYPVQTVSATDPDLRQKTLAGVSLKAERMLTKCLKAHASYSWDRSISNLEFDDYHANVVVGGLALVF